MCHHVSTGLYYIENYKKNVVMNYSQADEMEGEIISYILYRNQSVCIIIIVVVDVVVVVVWMSLVTGFFFPVLLLNQR